MSAQFTAVQPQGQVAVLKARVKEAERPGICRRHCGWREELQIWKRANNIVRSPEKPRVYNVGNSLATGRVFQWHRKINSIVCSS